MTTSCSISPEAELISGTYMAKGVFEGRIIYEKTAADRNGNWWSFRYENSSNHWSFSSDTRRVTIGQSIFGSIIEDCSNRQGKLRIGETIELKHPFMVLRLIPDGY